MPHIEEFRIPELLDFAKDHWEINKFMSEYDSENIHLENGFKK